MAMMRESRVAAVVVGIVAAITVAAMAGSIVTGVVDDGKIRAAMAKERAEGMAEARANPAAVVERAAREEARTGIVLPPRPTLDAERARALEARVGALEDRDRKLTDRMAELEIDMNRAAHLIADAVDPDGGPTAAAAVGRRAIAEEADERTLRDSIDPGAPTVMEKGVGTTPPWARVGRAPDATAGSGAKPVR